MKPGEHLSTGQFDEPDMYIEQRPLLSGEWVRYHREHRYLSQIQLAQMVETTNVTICKIETGRMGVSHSMEKRILSAFENIPFCPSDECEYCTGAACSLCVGGNVHCDHDVIDRHGGCS